jgi:hypothetical protein
MAIVHLMLVKFRFPRILSDYRLKAQKLMYRKPLVLPDTISKWSTESEQQIINTALTIPEAGGLILMQQKIYTQSGL